MCPSAHVSAVSYFDRSEEAVFTSSGARRELQKPPRRELLFSVCASHKPCGVTETWRPDERCCNTRWELFNLPSERHGSKGHLSEAQRRDFNVIKNISTAEAGPYCVLILRWKNRLKAPPVAKCALCSGVNLPHRSRGRASTGRPVC